MYNDGSIASRLRGLHQECISLQSQFLFVQSLLENSNAKIRELEEENSSLKRMLEQSKLETDESNKEGENGIKREKKIRGNTTPV
jgi:capsule polysaccharide export protein KpsE/RkpR